MPFWGRRPSTPKPISKPSSRPGQVQKPVLKKPASKPAPKGLFGEKKYCSFVQLREFAKKLPHRSYSQRTAKRLTKKQRIDLINKWRIETGRSHGLSGRDFDLLIAKKKKEMTWVNPTKKKELKIEVDAMESFKKGI